MICRTKEITIPEDKPFLNCKLNRIGYATILTKVVGQLNEGGVLSICGEWGTGKTTFVKMWEQYLKNESFQTLYFNVWEHDFVSDPLIGIIAQFRKLVPDEGAKQKLSDISKSFLSILSGMVPKIAKGVATRCIGDEAAEVIEAGVEKATNSFHSILDEYEDQCKSINDFRECLRTYVEKLSDGKPIVFIVDELDRCNPIYAVKTLERIKHLFSIPGIVFVLSIDKEQLCNSIKGYFGSEQLNAEEYLKRFIDYEYILPTPNIQQYCKYLYDQYNFDEFFQNVRRRNFFSHEDEVKEFLQMTETLFFNIHLNLRQIEKQFSHLRIALMTFRKEEYVHPGVLVLLEYFRHKHYDFYVKIRNRSYNIDELVAELENKFPHSIISRSADYDQSSSRFIWDVAKFLCCYCQDDKFRGESIKLITEGDNPELCFEVTTFNKETLSQMIKYNFDYKRSNGIYDICILIDHLELLYDLTEN